MKNEMLEKVQDLLQINQKELGVYIGVSTRTVNSWMTGERSCPDHVAEMALRLAKADTRAIENAEPTTTMKRWAVISNDGTDEFLTVCGSKADAIREAEIQWSHTTEAERAKCEIFVVGLINVQIIEKRQHSGRFGWAEDESWEIDSTVYEIAKDYLEK